MQAKPSVLGRGPVRQATPLYTSSPFEPQTPSAERLADIDLTDPRLLLLGDPHATWRLLREQAPVFWHEKGTRGTRGQGFWAVTTHADCTTVHRDSEVYTNTDTVFMDLLPDDIPLQLSAMDAPEHMQYRRALMRFFTPKAIEKLAENVRQVVVGILDRAEKADTAGDSVNFHPLIAEPLPFLATCNLLGISADGAHALAEQLRQLDYAGKEPLKVYTEAVMKFFDDVTADWVRPEEGDIVSEVLNADIGGKPITRHDALAYLWIVFTGALDTTAHAATIGLLSLFHHPDQLDKLKGDLGLMPGAVEELLRWASTSNVVKHRALVDTELSGVRIKAGDFVATYPPSANRDAKAFSDPFRFDITRKKEGAIFTFGGGPHVCLGQHFARLELRILFEELLTRFPDIQQAGPSVRGEAFTLVLSPVSELPVRLRPRG